MTIEAPSGHIPFPWIAEMLRRHVDQALPQLRAIPATKAAESRGPGKWSAQQVIGHLIDSAANNHQRFVRAQQAPAYRRKGGRRFL